MDPDAELVGVNEVDCEGEALLEDDLVRVEDDVALAVLDDVPVTVLDLLPETDGV